MSSEQARKIQVAINNVICNERFQTAGMSPFTQVENNFICKFGNETFLSYNNGYFYNCPILFEMQNEAKYTKITGKRIIFPALDFLYHWITDFSHLHHYDDLRSAITDPALCGSYATTIAVNKYIERHALSENQIKGLLKGSHWRWKKESGYYTQTTLYPLNYMGFTAMATMSHPLFTSAVDIQPFSSWLYTKVVEEQTYMRQQEEALRNQPRELLSNSTRATSTFNFKSDTKSIYKTFLGVELELEGFSQKEFKTLDILKDHAIFKRDGSLNEGVEICTAPATINLHKEAFKLFFDAIVTNKSKLKEANTCGLHVHIDKRNLSSLHVANIHLLINKPENKNQIVQIAGREPNQYCQQEIKEYNFFTSKQRDENRYRAVNLRNEDTIELRLFAATTNYNDFCKRLEFSQAVVDYTRPGETSIPVAQIPWWNNFKEYVKKNYKHYPILAKEV